MIFPKILVLRIFASYKLVQLFITSHYILISKILFDRGVARRASSSRLSTESRHRPSSAPKKGPAKQAVYNDKTSWLRSVVMVSR
jgi:hypothetical protein